MSCDAAYNILLDMGPKLDPHLRRECQLARELRLKGLVARLLAPPDSKAPGVAGRAPLNMAAMI
jgi:hypothetical protein